MPSHIDISAFVTRKLSVWNDSFAKFQPELYRYRVHWLLASIPAFPFLASIFPHIFRSLLPKGDADALTFITVVIAISSVFVIWLTEVIEVYQYLFALPKYPFIASVLAIASIDLTLFSLDWRLATYIFASQIPVIWRRCLSLPGKIFDQEGNVLRPADEPRRSVGFIIGFLIEQGFVLLCMLILINATDWLRAGQSIVSSYFIFDCFISGDAADEECPPDSVGIVSGLLFMASFYSAATFFLFSKSWVRRCSIVPDASRASSQIEGYQLRVFLGSQSFSIVFASIFYILFGFSFPIILVFTQLSIFASWELYFRNDLNSCRIGP